MRLVELGFACDNACVFCAQGGLRDRSAPLKDAEVRARIREAAASAGPGAALAFVGGEPTLHQALPSWIEEARRCGAAWVLVQTNGRRLGRTTLASTLRAAGADAVDVSIHGSTPPMHDYHTGTAGSWEETTEGIRRAAAAGLAVGTTTVVTRSNFRHLVEIVELAASLGADAVHLPQARPFGRAAEAWERVVPARELAVRHLTPAVRRARELRFETVAFGRASSSTARRRFAGLGPVEPAEARASALDGSGGKAARRPVPGRGEVHTKERKTGEALREIFPRLFGA